VNAPLTPQTWHQTGHYTTHRRQRVFFHDEGQGEVLVLLHGFPTSSFDWYRLWPNLTARYRVIAPDFVGFGYSAKPRRYAYAIHDQADWVESLLRERGVTACHLLVHDYGNTVAQELLARFAERRGGTPVLLSCCFLNGGLFPEMHRALPVQKLLNGPLGGLLTLLTNRNTLRTSLNRLYAPPGVAEAELDAFWHLVRHHNGHRLMHRLIHYINDRRRHRDRWVGILQTTPVPLRLIDGPEDPVSGRHMADYYQQLVPNPDVVLLPGVGHYPQTEAPDATLQAYLAFREWLKVQ
jgi:pimeloyl-ACP methyl ester carboxylesterase